MNLQADPVGYKALSRHFASQSRSGAELAEDVREQGWYIRLGAIAASILAAFAVLAVLHVSRPIAMPVVLAIVIGLILGPVCDSLQRLRIPPAVSALTIVLASLLAFSGVVYVVSPSLSDFTQAMPKISRTLERLSSSIEGLFSVFETLKRGVDSAPGALVTQTRSSSVDIAASVAGILTPAFSQLMIFVFTLLLFVASRQDIRTATAMMCEDRERRLAVLKSFSQAETRLAEYILAVTAVNMALGLTVACVFWIANIPGAMVWGVLAFIANFLPVVGPLLIKGLLLVFGLATTPSLVDAALPFLLFLAVSLIEANLVTPRIVGKRMTMSPLMVFLSVVFWTWLWGFAGAFLAMPILAIISVMRDSFAGDAAPKLPG